MKNCHKKNLFRIGQIKSLFIPFSLIAASLLIDKPAHAAALHSQQIIQSDADQQYADCARQIADRGRAASSLAKTSPGGERVIDRQALIWDTDRDPLDVVLRRTNALLNYLKDRQGAARFRAIENRLAQLAAENLAYAPAAGLAKTNASSTAL